MTRHSWSEIVTVQGVGVRRFCHNCLLTQAATNDTLKRAWQWWPVQRLWYRNNMPSCPGHLPHPEDALIPGVYALKFDIYFVKQAEEMRKLQDTYKNAQAKKLHGGWK